MAIRLSAGQVVLKNGAASCKCCSEINEFNLNLGEQGECNCTYPTEEDPNTPRPCFTISNPAPQFINGQTNPYYPLALWGGDISLQIPWDFTTTPAPGWKALANQPTLYRLSGAVGGDVILRGQTVGATLRYEGSPIGAMNFVFTPQENEYPCGECEKNGSHPFLAEWVVYPFTIYTVSIVTYQAGIPGTGQIGCSPWIRAKLEAVGAAP